MPKQVADEIMRRGPEDPTARALREAKWLVIQDVSEIPATIRAWGLGDGESAVLAWALAHPGSEAIIDDISGRRCAAALGIPVRGTLGLVLEARETGEIALARPILERLRQSRDVSDGRGGRSRTGRDWRRVRASRPGKRDLPLARRHVTRSLPTLLGADADREAR